MANYLYNDREAPDINAVWTDKEKLPFACICRSRSNGAAGTSVLFSSAPFIVEVRLSYGSVDDYFGVVLGNTDGTAIKECYNPMGTDEWHPFEDAFEPNIGNAIGEQVIHWANADVYAEDGSVFMTATEPVPVGGGEPIDKASFLQGYIVGRRLAGMRGKVTEQPEQPEEPSGAIVGYSYNGVTLPDINEVWPDKETYPYAVIYTYHGASEAQNPIHRLVLSDVPFAIVHKTFVLLGKEYNALEWDGNYIAKWKIVTWDYWDNDGSGTAGSNFSIDSENDAVVWTNADIRYADDYSGDETLAGTVYLAASAPVPVYE